MMSPPAWAEWLLTAILPANRVESESGDLLEAYRDEQLPTRGRGGADRWYLRQVGIIFMHSYWFWLAPQIALFVLSDVVNSYRGHPSALFLHVPMGLVLGASLHGGWRTHRFWGGLVAGLSTCALVWLFMASWWMTTWYPFAQVQQVQPYWIDAWHYSAAPGETFMHWIFWDNVGASIMSGLLLSATGLTIGLVGGLAGSAARRLAGRASENH